MRKAAPRPACHLKLKVILRAGQAREETPGVDLTQAQTPNRPRSSCQRATRKTDLPSSPASPSPVPGRPVACYLFMSPCNGSHLPNSQASSLMSHVPQCTPTLFLMPICIAMRTAPSGSVCCRCICQRGSYDPIGIAARSTGPRTRPTAANSVEEYLLVSSCSNQRFGRLTLCRPSA